MGQVMAQNIVADDMVEALAEGIKFWQIGLDGGIHNQVRCLGVLCHCREGEDPSPFGINFEIDGNTALQDVRRFYVCDRIHSRITNCLSSSL